jgi:hypothetical protein
MQKKVTGIGAFHEVSYTHFREVDSDIWWDDTGTEVHTGFDHDYSAGRPGLLAQTTWLHDDAEVGVLAGGLEVLGTMQHEVNASEG